MSRSSRSGLGACDVERHRLRRRRPDRDGRRDIAMLEGAGVAIHAGARRVMAAPVTVDLPGLDIVGFPKALATSDLTGTAADIVVTSAWNAEAGEARVPGWRTPRSSQMRASVLHRAGQQGGGPGALKIGDVTGDGRADVAVLHNGGDVGVFRQTAAGTLAAEHPMDGASATTFFSPDSLGIGDLDGDGVAISRLPATTSASACSRTRPRPRSRAPGRGWRPPPRPSTPPGSRPRCGPR